jgi:hypothetical protein
MPILIVKNNAGQPRLELPPHFDPKAARILRDAAVNFGLLLQRSEQLEGAQLAERMRATCAPGAKRDAAVQALCKLDVDSDDECDNSESSGNAAVERLRA